MLALPSLVRAATDPADPAGRRSVMRWTMASPVAHLVCGMLLTVPDTIRSYVGPDSYTYHDQAKLLLAHWTTGTPVPALPGGKEGYYHMLAGIYWLFGAHPAAGLAVNAVLASAVVPLVFDSTRRLFGREAARYAPPLVVLMPSMFAWTSQLLKEAPVVFLVAVMANCAVRTTERFSLGPVVVATAALSLLLTFRGPVAFALGVGALAGIALGNRRLSSGLTVGLVATALAAMLVLTLGLGRSGYDASVQSDLQQAGTVRTDLALSGSSGFDANVDISSPRAALSYLPVGVLQFSVGPFPWQIRGVRQLPALPDVLVWWCLLPSLGRGALAAGRRWGRRWLVLALPAVTATLLLGLTVGNFGTLVRERVQVLVLLLPVMALGLSERPGRRPAHR
jgi:4-amino-4-deoxy-L-arabinose transferase-like glycosyltransferase